MAALTIDIPDDVKNRCEKIFVGQTLEEMLARLLREALEQETMRRRTEAVDRLLALALLSALRAGTIVVRQPFHWLAEVAAVGVRLKPDTIIDDIADLQELGIISVAETQPLWKIACSLAIRLNHHLFDTLYHAVALQSDALLITAHATRFTPIQEGGFGHIDELC